VRRHLIAMAGSTPSERSAPAVLADRGAGPINGDMKLRACMDTASMDWQASPSGTVWRKRVHLVGEPESGQVTSVVRYEPGASFPQHDHPEGEEILVLEGVFSDEHGDWPAGTYLLNPEGFRHAPFSRDGCLLFVKLRQYGGEERFHVAAQTQDMPWKPSGRAGVEVKKLYARGGESDEGMQLELWHEGASPGPVAYAEGVEMLVLSGSFQDEVGSYREGTWLRLPAGGSHEASSPAGCELYVKRGGVSALRSL
jgi:anti-sigma factor ChrR (cupin superfamily)